jgi:hypothetical protein
MYDRQTESLWSQIEGRAIAGLLAGAELDRVPVQTVTWAQWKQAYPDGWVLSRDTGVTRDYGRNPYTGYDGPATQPFLFDGRPDPRLPPNERVAALGGDADPVAVPQRGCRSSTARPWPAGARPPRSPATPRPGPSGPAHRAPPRSQSRGHLAHDQRILWHAIVDGEVERLDGLIRELVAARA